MLRLAALVKFLKSQNQPPPPPPYIAESYFSLILDLFIFPDSRYLRAMWQGGRWPTRRAPRASSPASPPPPTTSLARTGRPSGRRRWRTSSPNMPRKRTRMRSAIVLLPSRMYYKISKKLAVRENNLNK